MRSFNVNCCHLRLVNSPTLSRQTILRLVNARSIPPHQNDADQHSESVRRLVIPSAVRGIFRQPAQFDLRYSRRLRGVVQYLFGQKDAVPSRVLRPGNIITRSTGGAVVQGANPLQRQPREIGLAETRIGGRMKISAAVGWPQAVHGWRQRRV